MLTQTEHKATMVRLNPRLLSESHLCGGSGTTAMPLIKLEQKRKISEDIRTKRRLIFNKHHRVYAAAILQLLLVCSNPELV